MLGLSWSDLSVLGSQFFGQASAESCDQQPRQVKPKLVRMLGIVVVTIQIVLIKPGNDVCQQHSVDFALYSVLSILPGSPPFTVSYSLLYRAALLPAETVDEHISHVTADTILKRWRYFVSCSHLYSWRNRN